MKRDIALGRSKGSHGETWRDKNKKNWGQNNCHHHLNALMGNFRLLLFISFCFLDYNSPVWSHSSCENNFIAAKNVCDRLLHQRLEMRMAIMSNDGNNHDDDELHHQPVCRVINESMKRRRKCCQKESTKSNVHENYISNTKIQELIFLLLFCQVIFILFCLVIRNLS